MPLSKKRHLTNTELEVRPKNCCQAALNSMEKKVLSNLIKECVQT